MVPVMCDHVRIS